jgi:MFS family permease
MDTTPERFGAADAGALFRARFAVSAVFFILGCGTGLWAVHIPVVAARLQIPHSTVGLALFAMAAGAVGTMPLTGWALGRLGSRRPTALLAFAFAVLTPIPIAAPSLWFLFVSAFLFGASMGGLDVAMNVQASEVEKAREKPTMSSFHGFYSVGTLAGSALGGLIIAAGLGNGTGATIAAAALLLIAIWASMNLWNAGRPAPGGPRFVLPPVAILGLGFLAFLTFAAEGGVTDWSALYLSTVKQSSTALAASGVVVFSIAMVVCRLTGDAIVARFGGRNTVLGGGILIAIGMALAVASPWPLLAAIGFGIVGVGAANVVPVAISASSRVAGVPPGIGVAATTSMGYAGFLVIPPILGFVATAWGLSASLLLVALMGLVIAALSRSVRDERTAG